MTAPASPTDVKKLELEIRAILSRDGGKLFDLGETVDQISNDESLNDDDTAKLFGIVEAHGGSSLRSDAHKLFLSGITRDDAIKYDGILGQTVVSRIAVKAKCSTKDGETGRFAPTVLPTVLKLASDHNAPLKAKNPQRVTARRATLFADCVKLVSGKLDGVATLAAYKTAIDVDRIKKADDALKAAQKRHAIQIHGAVAETAELGSNVADAVRGVAKHFGHDTDDAQEAIDYLAKLIADGADAEAKMAKKAVAA